MVHCIQLSTIRNLMQLIGSVLFFFPPLDTYSYRLRTCVGSVQESGERHYPLGGSAADLGMEIAEP